MLISSLNLADLAKLPIWFTTSTEIKTFFFWTCKVYEENFFMSSEQWTEIAETEN